MAPQNIIAVIFDFDDTLTDDSTTKLLESHGFDARDFWENRMKKLTDSGWDPPLAYMKLILDSVGTGKPLGNLTNEKLNSFGKALEFYKGIPKLFGDLQQLVKGHRLSNPAIEFYIISGGLEEIIRGTKIASFFTGIWGCRFHEEEGCIKQVMNAISFTEKTKYIFAINKGVGKQVRKEVYAVNKKIERSQRRIPFENMIYIGDGLTDVPCFSLMEQYGGKPFGVFDPKKKDSPKKAWEQLVVPKRVATMNSPHFGKKDDLGALLRAAVEAICFRMDSATGTVES
jgi:phosphoserine phosphatase